MQYRRAAGSSGWWIAAVLAVAGSALAQAPGGEPGAPDPRPAPKAPPATPQAQPVAPTTPPDGSALPPEAPRPRLSVEITSLSVGRDGPSSIRKGFGGSFLTDSAQTLQVQAEARVPGDEALTRSLRWEITPPARFAVPAGALLTGPKLDVRLVRLGGNPKGTGAPLRLTVKAIPATEGAAVPASVFLAQDDRDRLRQEYVDLDRSEIPSREDLIDEGEFYRRFGRKYREVRFDELNSSLNPATGAKYPAIPITEQLVRTIHAASKEYGRPVQITSCFRNPVRQEAVHAGVEESHHQYGRAVDLYVAPRSVLEGKPVASEQDWLRLASAALRAGGTWIEPMEDCGVNTTACHVHVDVRDSGPRSRLVTVQGQVTDPSGNPQPGVTVKLAGMPVRANAEGKYLLKHVLFTPEAELTVEAPGRGPVNRQVMLVDSPVVVNMTIPADPQPTLIARVEPAQRDSTGVANLRVSFKNAGLSEARVVKLAVSMADPRLTLGEVAPAELPSIPAGSEGACSVRVTVSPEDAAGQQSVQATLTVGAVYQTPTGETKTQSWKLLAQVDPSPQPSTVGMPATAPQQASSGSVIRMSGRGGVDFGAMAGGLLLGALAGAFSFYTRPRRPHPGPQAKPEPEPEPEAPGVTHLPVEQEPAPLPAPEEPASEWETIDPEPDETAAEELPTPIGTEALPTEPEPETASRGTTPE